MSPFAPRKCAPYTHFRGAKGDTNPPFISSYKQGITMKRKIAFALVCAAVGGTMSCFSLGQDPFGPARAPRETITRTINAGGDVQSVTIAGADLATTNLAIAHGDNPQQANVASLVKLLKTAEGAEKESVVAKLKSAVGEQFDQRQEGKAKELKALEEQLAKLKEIHAKRTQQRDVIIAERVQQILRDAEGLGWGTDSQDSTSIFSTNPSSDWGRYPGTAIARPLGTTLNRLSTPSIPATPVTPAAPVAPLYVVPGTSR